MYISVCEIRNKINKIAHDTPLTSPPYCLAKYYFMNCWPFLVILKRKWIITLGWWRYSTSDILVIFVQWVQVKQILQLVWKQKLQDWTDVLQSNLKCSTCKTLWPSLPCIFDSVIWTDDRPIKSYHTKETWLLLTGQSI